MDFDEDAATQFYNSDDPMMGTEWSVNISDDDTRTMRAVEVAYEYIQGNLDANDTYVWREGQDDWVPLAHCDELQQVISQYQAGQPGGGGDASDFESTLASQNQPPAYGGYDADAFEPTAMNEVQRESGEAMIGERNEASALFSLDAINAAQAVRRGDSVRPKRQEKNDDFDDIFSMGGGLGGGGGIASAFAPPPIHAPAPPPPAPKPIAAPVASMSPAMAAAALSQPPQKSRKGLFIALGAGALLLILMGVTFALMSGPDEDPTAANTATDTDDKKDGDTAPASDTDDKKDDDAVAAKDDDKDEDDKKDDGDKDDGDKDEDEDDKKDDAASTTKPGSAKAFADAAKASSKKDDDKKPSKKKKKKKKKDDKKKPKGDFDVNAARSALSAAAGSASGCKKKGGPTGKGRVAVTFAPSGRATTASVGPPFGGTSTGSCAAGIFRRASVPPFKGSAVTVSKSFFIR